MATSEKSIRDKDVIPWLLYAVRNPGYGSVIDIRHPHPGKPGREGGVSSTPGAADIVVLAMTTPAIFFPSIPVAIAIELKTEDGKQSEDQERWQKEWERQGGIYLLARNSTELQQEFERLGIPTAEVRSEADVADMLPR